MTKAAIVGGGVIGGGWAARFLLNGWDVAVFDPDPEAERRIGEVLSNARAALPMLYETRLPDEGRLEFAESLGHAVEGAAYVQESIPEQLELKRQVFSGIAAVNRDAIIGSSTSGFKPSDLAAGLGTGERMIVAHAFDPVYLLPLVELVGPDETMRRAGETLRSIGMYPLPIGTEIDAHIAGRLLASVRREALWLVQDGVATTGEIDEAIRMGFGLHWAQMGLFDHCRITGGEGGLAQSMRRLEPGLKLSRSRLTDAPELSDDLAERIGRQSDAQSGTLSVRELERLRDRNLVAILRALKREGSAAGRLIAEHERALPMPDMSGVPMLTVARVIPSDWTDHNGHMNESRYGQIWSDASDAVLAHVGAGMDYVARGFSYFTVETRTRFLLESHAGDAVRCETRVTLGEGKKLGLAHCMLRMSDGAVLASCDQIMIHVSLETRKSCAPASEVLARIEALARRHR